jgi:hypothetical protein
MFEKLLLAATITFSLNLFSGLRPEASTQQLSTEQPVISTVRVANDVSNQPLFPLQKVLQ